MDGKYEKHRLVQSPSSVSLPPNLAQADTSVSFGAAGKMCGESVERIQLVAELLLLQSGRDKPAALEPVSAGHESYAKSRDAIVAHTKGLAISIKEFGKRLHGKDPTAVYQLANRIADQVVLLTEASTHAAYFSALNGAESEPASPPVVDRYALSRARQELKLAYGKFKPDYGALTREQVTQVSGVFADNLSILSRTCKQASENKTIRISDRVQFSNCAQGLQGATAAFLTSLKSFAGTNSSEDRRKCVLFGRPLIEMANSIVEYAHFSQFRGSAAKISEESYQAQTEVLAGAMAIVGATIQLLNTGRNIVEDSRGGDVGWTQGAGEQWQKLVNCSKAVADATRLLAAAIRTHTPLPSALPSTLQSCTSLDEFLN